jgi:hypothetical protein
MVFAHILAITQHARTQLHGAHMGGGADLRGTAHGVLFVRVFHQTHFIQQYTQVLLHRGTGHAHSRTGPHFVQPAVYVR